MMLFGFGSYFECKICGKTAKMMDLNNEMFCNNHRNLAITPTDETRGNAQK